MSPRVDADSEELRKFAAQLREFNNQLEQITYRIEGQVHQLGDTWRDDQYGKFTEEWYSTFRAINKYLDAAPDYVRHILIKASKLEEYRG